METTARTTVHELGLVAAGPDGTCRDVRVEYVADAPARELLDALADELGLDGEPAARRAGEELPAEAPLAELALRHGDEIRFGDDTPAPPTIPAVAELVVTGGPQAGRRVPLPPGVHRVGREASIAIEDPSLSAQHLVLTIGADGSVTVADAGSRNGTLVEGVTLPACRGAGAPCGRARPGGPDAARRRAAGGRGARRAGRPLGQGPVQPSAARPAAARGHDPAVSRPARRSAAIAAPARCVADPAGARDRALRGHEAADDAPLLAPLSGDGAFHVHRGPAQRAEGLREAHPGVPAPARGLARRARGRAARRGRPAASSGTVHAGAAAAGAPVRAGALGAAA